MYDSRLTTNFQDSNPSWGRQFDHLGFKANGWKSKLGAINEGEKLQHCLNVNRKLWLEATINFEKPLTEHEHQIIWKHISRYLRAAGVIAFYKRELNELGWIHYHLVTGSNHNIKAFKKTLKDSIPKEIKSVSRVHAGVIKNQWAISTYIAKMKMEGYDEFGKYCADKHWSKRRIFKKECKLAMHGTIGKFWLKPMAEIWKDHVKREKEIASYKPRYMARAKQVADILGDDEVYGAILRVYCVQALERNEKPPYNDDVNITLYESVIGETIYGEVEKERSEKGSSAIVESVASDDGTGRVITSQNEFVITQNKNAECKKLITNSKTREKELVITNSEKPKNENIITNQNKNAKCKKLITNSKMAKRNLVIRKCEKPETKELVIRNVKMPECKYLDTS
jgi:hypothetical protein